jgi:hypothetical protein
MTAATQAALLEALKLAEWVVYDNPDWGSQTFCPVCRNDKKYGHYEGCQLAAAIASVEAQPPAPEPVARALAEFREALLRDLEEPDDELLAEFQRAFLQQLKRRKHKGGESAEIAGARAMFKLAFSRERAPHPTHQDTGDAA